MLPLCKHEEGVAEEGKHGIYLIRSVHQVAVIKWPGNSLQLTEGNLRLIDKMLSRSSIQ